MRPTAFCVQHILREWSYFILWNWWNRLKSMKRRHKVNNKAIAILYYSIKRIWNLCKWSVTWSLDFWMLLLTILGITFKETTQIKNNANKWKSTVSHLKKYSKTYNPINSPLLAISASISRSSTKAASSMLLIFCFL